MNICISCKGTEFKQGEGAYSEYEKCVVCNLYRSEKIVSKLNVILPDDPMDELLCEGCT